MITISHPELCSGELKKAMPFPRRKTELAHKSDIKCLFPAQLLLRPAKTQISLCRASAVRLKTAWMSKSKRKLVCSKSNKKSEKKSPLTIMTKFYQAHQVPLIKATNQDQGPVVQSVVSLTSSLVVNMSTVLVSTISN